MTNLAIIYGKESGALRRFIRTDKVDNFERRFPMSPGEVVVFAKGDDVARMTAEQLHDLATAELSKVLGKAPPVLRCAMVNQKGDVVGAIMADPAIDSVEGHTLHLHDQAGAGWKIRDGVLAAPPAEASAE